MNAVATRYCRINQNKRLRINKTVVIPEEFCVENNNNNMETKKSNKKKFNVLPSQESDDEKMACRRLKPSSPVSSSESARNCSEALSAASFSGEEPRLDSGSFVTSREMSDRDVGCQNPTPASSPGRIFRLREGKEPQDSADDRNASMRSFRTGTATTTKTNSSSKRTSNMMQSTEAEVDSRDPPVAVEPLHIVGLSDLPPACSSTATIQPTPVTPRKPRLTLSAFRRPEQTVRLTDSDPSRRLEDEYDLRSPECRVLGHGAFSTVRLAIRIEDRVKVAVKSIAKHDALRARRLRRRSGSRHMDEWEILRRMSHNPYIISLIDVFETDEEIHIITEYCEGGELFDAIQRKGNRRSSFRRGRYSEPQAARITYQILHALKDLHSQSIVHRDVKPENILLLSRDESDMQVKLCDFGIARLHRYYTDPPSDGETSPSTPSLSYTTNSAPEVCKGSGGPAVDVYSCGVTLYILLCGFPPVFLDDYVVFPDAYWLDISEEAKSILRKMLHPDPCQRIPASDALKNPWIRQQTTRVRRGSISANLELVRNRLYRSQRENSSSVKRVRGFSKQSPRKRRSIIGASTTPSVVAYTMSDLYQASEKRDVRVIDDTIETRTGEDVQDLTTTSSGYVPRNVACG